MSKPNNNNNSNLSNSNNEEAYRIMAAMLEKRTKKPPLNTSRLNELRRKRLEELEKKFNTPPLPNNIPNNTPTRNIANKNKFKKQLNSISKNYGVLVNNKQRVNSNLEMKNGLSYITLSIPNKNAYLIVKLNTITKKINLAKGATAKSNRGKGYGTLLRAIPVLASKNTGFKSIAHFGVFNNSTQRSKYNTPPSTWIVRKKLGFRNIGGPLSFLNVNNINEKAIRGIINKFKKKN